jgi:hypothetical protein
VDTALRDGCRGVQGGSSLALFLAGRRPTRSRVALPRLSYKKILAWADAHKERTGRWPNVNSGEVQEAPGERWRTIDNALRQGDRRLRGNTTLLQLLVRKRGVRDPLHPPDLTTEQILRWAQLHRDRAGCWPKYKSGPILDAPGETWAGIDSALRYGNRTLPVGSSLANLLDDEMSKL